MKRKAPIMVQAADVLRRARKLPIGPARNDLRQLARGLLTLHRAGMRAGVRFVETPTRHPSHLQEGLKEEASMTALLMECQNKTLQGSGLT